MNLILNNFQQALSVEHVFILLALMFLFVQKVKSWRGWGREDGWMNLNLNFKEIKLPMYKLRAVAACSVYKTGYLHACAITSIVCLTVFFYFIW